MIDDVDVVTMIRHTREVRDCIRVGVVVVLLWLFEGANMTMEVIGKREREKERREMKNVLFLF